LVEQEGLCWLCRKEIESRFEVHHLDGGRDPRSGDVAALHSECHNALHKISVFFNGQYLRFEGKALDLLGVKARRLKWTDER